MAKIAAGDRRKTKKSSPTSAAGDGAGDECDADVDTVPFQSPLGIDRHELVNPVRRAAFDSLLTQVTIGGSPQHEAEALQKRVVVATDAESDEMVKKNIADVDAVVSPPEDPLSSSIASAELTDSVALQSMSSLMSSSGQLPGNIATAEGALEPLLLFVYCCVLCYRACGSLHSCENLQCCWPSAATSRTYNSAWYVDPWVLLPTASVHGQLLRCHCRRHPLLPGCPPTHPLCSVLCAHRLHGHLTALPHQMSLTPPPLMVSCPRPHLVRPITSRVRTPKAS